MNEDLLEQSGIEVDARTARFWKKNRSPMEDDPKYRDLKKLIGELARRAAQRLVRLLTPSIQYKNILRTNVGNFSMIPNHAPFVPSQRAGLGVPQETIALKLRRDGFSEKEVIR